MQRNNSVMQRNNSVMQRNNSVMQRNNNVMQRNNSVLTFQWNFLLPSSEQTKQATFPADILLPVCHATSSNISEDGYILLFLLSLHLFCPPP
jgi:hypothetical protein